MRLLLWTTLLLPFVAFTARSAPATDVPNVPNVPKPPPQAEPVGAPQGATEVDRRSARRRLRHDIAMFQAALLVEEARRCQAEKEDALASDLYDQALACDPGNAAAAAGRDELRRCPKQRDGHAPAVVFGDHQKRILIDFELAALYAEAAIGRGDLVEGETDLERARAVLCADPAGLGLAEVRRLNARLTYLFEYLVLDPAAVAEAQRRRRQEPGCFRNLDATIANLIAQARQLTDAGDYGGAIEVLDQILVLDPGNDYAAGVRPMLESKKARADADGERK